MDLERIEKICKDCKKKFSYAHDEELWLIRNGMEPYKRCGECRARKRLERQGSP